jgi:hypothetical protein
MKVLLLNHSEPACGVYQFGKRVYESAKLSDDVDYQYAEVTSPDKYFSVVQQVNPDYIVYNWHRATMSWLTPKMTEGTPYKNYFLFHEEHLFPVYDKYLFFGDYDFDNKLVSKDKQALLPRPLLDYTGEYPKNDKITVGSFGFAFWQKNYDKITKLVNDTMNDVVLRYHMPRSTFGDSDDSQGTAVIRKCRTLLTNQSIELQVTRELLSTDKVLEFLAGNDINIFLYSENGEGISSVIDYALSVKRPIIVSNCKMFRHILSDDIILSDTNKITDVLDKGITPLLPYYNKWSTKNFRKEMDKLFLC